MPDIDKIDKTYTGDGDYKAVTIQIDDDVVGLNKFNVLNDLVGDEMKKGIMAFTFDLTNLTSINSSGLGILIGSLKKIKDSKGSLKVVNVNEKILNVFKLTKLDNVFEINT